MPETQTRIVGRIEPSQVYSASISEMVSYHLPGDIRLPLVKDKQGEVDLLKIPNCLLIELAARIAKSRKVLAVSYSHPSASCTSNGYTGKVLVVDRNHFCLTPHDMIRTVGEFGAVKPAIRQTMLGE